MGYVCKHCSTLGKECPHCFGSGLEPGAQEETECCLCDGEGVVP